MLESTPAKIRHMICLSDGHTQPADHESFGEEMSEAGITVSTAALGDADKQLMSPIVELGHGRYYETADAANVPQNFTKETMEATRAPSRKTCSAACKLATIQCSPAIKAPTCRLRPAMCVGNSGAI